MTAIRPPLPAFGRRQLIGGALLATLPGSAAAVSLNDHANRGNRFFGAAVADHTLNADPDLMDSVAAECGMVTGETAFKWGELRPTAEAPDFTAADQLVAFAHAHRLQVRGHTLLWHEHNPQWLIDSITPANAERLLTRHVRTVAGHFRTRLVHWDVVNEVLQSGGGAAGLRDTIWSRALGPHLLDIAFGACAEADPVPLRFINEYGLDYAWAPDERKRAAMLELLAAMRSRGVPVQGLGIQAHLEAGVAELDQARLAAFCRDVAGLGLKIVITELDVRDNRIAGDPALRDDAVAAHARAYLDAVLSCPAVLGVLTWGLSDRRSWLNDDLPRDDKLAQRALPLDDRLRRKKLWQAMADAFDAAPARA